MRTTITLEDDVAAAIDRIRRIESRSLRDVVNELLRHGLARLAEPLEPTSLVRTRAVSLGRCRLLDVDNVAEVLAIAEGKDGR